MRWEYITLSNVYAGCTIDDFCELGLQGWELVSVARDIAYFKRPVNEFVDYSRTVVKWKK